MRWHIHRWRTFDGAQSQWATVRRVCGTKELQRLQRQEICIVKGCGVIEWRSRMLEKVTR